MDNIKLSLIFVHQLKSEKNRSHQLQYFQLYNFVAMPRMMPRLTAKQHSTILPYLNQNISQRGVKHWYTALSVQISVELCMSERAFFYHNLTWTCKIHKKMELNKKPHRHSPQEKV